jgi:CHAD domain-containing protein
MAGDGVGDGLLEFVLDGAAAGNGSPLAAVGPNFGWAADGRARTVRRTWLDTFDWRLYRAGLTLELRSSRGLAELTLTGRDRKVIATQQIASRPRPPAARITWPSRLDALPAGPLTERLEPVVGVRALAPVARAVSRITDQRALNTDQKTVARLAVDTMSVTFPASATAQPRLTVWPLRGYQAQATRLGELLAAAPGVAVSSQSALEAALAAGGRQPGDYSGKIEVRLTAEMPAGQALAAVLTALLDTLEANVSGTVRDVDTEFLHDLRVAVRRTRSALKLAGGALPGGLAKRFAPEFSWLGALTTPTRDLDVYLLAYPGMASGLVAATPAELEPFRAYLEHSRAKARRQLVSGLRSARFDRVAGQWRAALSAVASGSRSGGQQKQQTAARLAAATITRAQRRVLAVGQAITDASPAPSLHDLRKRCKELRYLLEMFGSLYDPAEYWQAVRALKDLQNCLGEFQDSEVQRAEIRMFAAQMLAERAAPAPTLLAMGEVAASLATRQRRARTEFGDRFRAFASPASQAKIRALTRAAR